MEPKVSIIKSPQLYQSFIEDWVQGVQTNSSTVYEQREVDTKLGKTVLYHAACKKADAPHLFFVPGWKTNGMFWDFGDEIQIYTPDFNVWLVDVVGQPGKSSPVVAGSRGDGYGLWLREVVENLGIEKAHFVGASFGCFILSKLAMVDVSVIDKVALLAPAGLTTIPLNPKFIYNYLRASFFPNPKNIQRFMRNCLYTDKNVVVGNNYDLIFEFKKFTSSGFLITEKPPYKLSREEWQALKAPSLVLSGNKDVFFKTSKVLKRAKADIPNLQAAEAVDGYGHVLEISQNVAKRVRRFLLAQG